MRGRVVATPQCWVALLSCCVITAPQQQQDAVVDDLTRATMLAVYSSSCEFHLETPELLAVYSPSL